MCWASSVFGVFVLFPADSSPHLYARRILLRLVLFGRRHRQKKKNTRSETKNSPFVTLQIINLPPNSRNKAPNGPAQVMAAREIKPLESPSILASTRVGVVVLSVSEPVTTNRRRRIQATRLNYVHFKFRSPLIPVLLLRPEPSAPSPLTQTSNVILFRNVFHFQQPCVDPLLRVLTGPVGGESKSRSIAVNRASRAIFLSRCRVVTRRGQRQLR